MRSPTVLRCLCALGLATALAACADDAPADDATYNCEADDRDEPFAINLARTGAGGTTFTIVSADPALPIRGNNAWVIDVSRDGAPVPATDGEFLVTPFMPDHRHGTGIKAIWTPDPATPGRFTVSPINLWMPGVWEVTFEETPTGGARDQVKFTFCITG